MTDLSPSLRSCRFCGLAQLVSPAPPGMQACCARCGSGFKAPDPRRNSRVAAIALAALILYPLAVSLPMLKVQQLGHTNETSVLQGITSLLADGQVIVGVIVLLCSVVFPLGKLISLLALTTWGTSRIAPRHKATVYRLVEWTGRWGMLDVLLVAVLVAVLKLGNWVEVTPGPAAVAFSACVLLSLLATAMFDPHSAWGSR